MNIQDAKQRRQRVQKMKIIIVIAVALLCISSLFLNIILAIKLTQLEQMIQQMALWII